MGEALRAQGRLDEAESVTRAALETYHEAYGPSHIRTTDPLIALARLLFERSRYDEAEPLYLEALEILE